MKVLLHPSVVQPVKGPLDISQHKGDPFFSSSSFLTGHILVDHGQRVSGAAILDESILVRVIEFVVGKKVGKSLREDLTKNLANNREKTYRTIV